MGKKWYVVLDFVVILNFSCTESFSKLVLIIKHCYLLIE